MFMETTSPLSDGVDIIWLAQRCCALHADSLHIPPQMLKALQQKADQHLESGDANGLIEVLEQLLDLLGLSEIEWQPQPASDALPMLALIPGSGCLLVYGKTDQGDWLLEGSQGSRRIVHFPAEARFTAIRPTAASNNEPPTALSVIRQALSSRKLVFVQAALASCLSNIFALATSIYSMQVYDRVIPSRGVQTLLVLTTGVTLVIIFDMVIKMARSTIMENFIKGADREISHKIFHRLAIEEYLSSIQGYLPPAKKAKLISIVYDLYAGKKEKKVDKAVIVNLFELAA